MHGSNLGYQIMKTTKNILTIIACCAGLIGSAYAANGMSGTASVNITSDTAATAKNMAMSDARRQIIGDVLRQYTDNVQLAPVLKKASGSELTNLISSSSIENEQTSDTTYSANISMTLDTNAARTWLDSNKIKHWLPGGETVVATFETTIQLQNGLSEWIEINRIARNEQINFITKNIHGNKIIIEIPSSKRGAFTIAVRESGWRYKNDNNNLQIWK